MQRKWMWILVAFIMAAGLTMAGCSKAPKKEAAPAAPAAEEPAAPAAEQPAAPAPTEYTFEGLCDKLIAETRAANSAAFTDDMAKQTRDGCLMAKKAYEASPKADAAMAAFSEAILKACEGKTGEDWVRCYADQAQAAGQAAADAMMK